MTYSSCCGQSSYGGSGDSYNGIDAQSASDHKMYEIGGTGSYGPTQGINDVAAAYMSVPECGKYQSLDSII